MVSAYFENFFAPRLPSSIAEWVVVVLIGVLLTCIVRFFLAWLFVTVRGFGGDGLWDGQEIIYDTKVWTDLLTTLLWASVIGYCVATLTYEHIYALVPYGAALFAGIVFSILSIRKLGSTVEPYRRAIR